MTPIGGKLSDIYGKKKILLIIMAVYTVGILAGRFATNIEFMLATKGGAGSRNGYVPDCIWNH